MIRTSNLIHKGLINISTNESQGPAEMNMNFGNKIALLSGDYLFSNSCSELAALRNQDVIIPCIYYLFSPLFIKLCNIVCTL